MQKAAIGIVISENHILLVKRQDLPLWVIPGGGIDEGETAEEAVVREVKEESGLDIAIERKVAEYSPINRLASFANLFQCRLLGGEIQASDETADVQFFPLEKLPKNLFFLHREWIDDALKNSSEIIRRPLKNISYPRAILYAFVHPIITMKYLYTRATKTM